MTIDKKKVKRLNVGILTLYYRNFNYGGVLQAYALQKSVEKLGVACQQISFDRFVPSNGKNKQVAPLKTRTREIVHRVFVFFKSILGAGVINYFTYIHSRDRYEKSFDIFINAIPHTELYDINNIGISNDKFDLFICGSDQIWNPLYSCESFFLTFTKKRKIAYAASLGVIKLDEIQKEKFRKRLADFHKISLREESAVEIITSVFDDQVEVCCDPSMLLTSDEWSEEVRKSQYVVDRPFVLIYFLGNIKENREKVSIIKKENPQYRYIVLPMRPEDLLLGEPKMDAGPNDFLWLIKNAEIILTDSFHACMFSIIFKKKFWIYMRSIENAEDSMNSRIINLLSRYHLENRLAMNMKTFHDTIDYLPVEREMSEYRDKSLDFLEEAIKE